MFAEMKEIDFLFARSSSLSRPASLDLGLFTNPSEMRLIACSLTLTRGSTMISAFTFSAMPRLIVGPGAIDRLGEIAASFGKNALLVTGAEALERSGKLSRMLGDLKTVGIRVHQYRIAGEPSPAMVDQAAVEFMSKGVEVVLAVGGGSVLDAGKAIAAMLKENGSVVDFLEGVGKRSPSGESVPVVAVPTTSGTGSEATKNAVISKVRGGGFKKSLRRWLLAIISTTAFATSLSMTNAKH